MENWLIAVQLAVPACGLTVFNVWQCPYGWWTSYVTQAGKYLEAVKEAHRGR